MTSIETNSRKIIETLKSFKSYVDLQALYSEMSRDAQPDYPMNLRDLIPSDQYSCSKQTIGMFYLESAYNYLTERIKVLVTRDNVSDNDNDVVYLRIDDLPDQLSHQIKTVEDLHQFLKCYENDSFEETEDEIERRFYLGPSGTYSPIDFERYMTANRFTRNWCCGPHSNPELERKLCISNTFEYCFKYRDILSQDSGVFSISVRSKYSNSLITVEIDRHDTICYVNYVPPLKNNITMPIDVILFLQALKYYDWQYLRDHWMNPKEINQSRLSLFDKIYTGDDDAYFEIVSKLYSDDIPKEEEEEKESNIESTEDINKLLQISVTDRVIDIELENRQSTSEADPVVEVAEVSESVRNYMAEKNLSHMLNADYMEFKLYELFRLVDDYEAEEINDQLEQESSEEIENACVINTKDQ